MTKKLSGLDATLLVSGSMIGSGIFIVTADMSQTLGAAGWVLLAWVITGVFTLFGALTYGELAGMMPKAGGQYVYIQRAFGRLTGFVYGWTVFTVIQTGVIAAVAMAFAKFLGVFVPKLGDGDKGIIFNIGGPEGYHFTWGKIIAVSMVLFLTWMNSRGVQEGKWIQRIFTFAKLIALFGLIICGLYFASQFDFFKLNWSKAWDAGSFPQNSTKDGYLAMGWQPLSGWNIATAMGLAMVGSLFSSDAWNNVTFIAGDIENPSKNIPRSLLAGTLVVTVIYILANIAYMSLLPLRGGVYPTIEAQGISHALEGRVGTAAASMIMGENGIFLMAGLIMISTFGCNNGLILSGARFYRAMAIDGLFFKKASVLNKNGVPGNALWIQGIWASVLCFSGSYNQLLDYCIFAALIFYIITASSLFVLRKREPNADRPYKVFGYPIIPAIFIIIALFVGLDLLYFKTTTAAIGLGIVGLGIPIYYYIKPEKTSDIKDA
ncbi:MAG: amino acid permease [Bacteroidia bacterium]|nr:amino acid permease [Bacteroidia bacterium]